MPTISCVAWFCFFLLFKLRTAKYVWCLSNRLYQGLFLEARPFTLEDLVDLLVVVCVSSAYCLVLIIDCEFEAFLFGLLQGVTLNAKLQASQLFLII